MCQKSRRPVELIFISVGSRVAERLHYRTRKVLRHVVTGGGHSEKGWVKKGMLRGLIVGFLLGILLIACGGYLLFFNWSRARGGDGSADAL